MGSDRFARIERLFSEALERPESERTAFLDGACGGDTELRSEIDALLSADASADGSFDEPLIRHGLSILPDGGGSAPPRDAVGSYRLIRKIGEGGMSEVYLAVRDDDAYKKSVAVKIIKDELRREDVLGRFRTERQILAGLDHPNIATLHDGGSTDDGLPYFVMEYIEGVPIDEYCARNGLSILERIELFRAVCTAVHYAHQNLIVHRDIKSSNILVTPDGVPKLLDFGIAKLIRPDTFGVRADHTATSARPMTPRYASPEQIRGGPVGTPSDVYSLGVLLYRLLTGRLPYRLEGRAETELPTVILEQDPERPSTAITRPDGITTGARGAVKPLQRQLRGDLDNILLMALRKEPNRRYASVEQFSDDLRRFREGLPVMARPDTFSYRTTKFVRRHRFGVAAGLAFVAVLVAFGVTMATQASRLARERDQVRLERDRAERVVGLLEDLLTARDPYEAERTDLSVEGMLERGAERVETQLVGQPDLQAALLHTIGSVASNSGMLDRGEAFLSRALYLRRDALGPLHPAVAETAVALGAVLAARGDLDDANELLEVAVSIRRAAEPLDRAALAAALNESGIIHRKLGNFDASAAAYTEAIELEQAAGVDDRRRAATTNNLASLKLSTGDFESAERLMRESLDMRRRAYGEPHPLVAQSLSNVGVCIGMQGRYDDAEPFLVEALAMYREALDPEHPNLVEPLNNLGKLFVRTGRHDEAEPLIREALRVQVKSVGEIHRSVGVLHGNLADLLAARGEWDAARVEAEAALRVRRQVYDDRHAEAGKSEIQLARILLGLGRASSAESRARAGLDILVEALPADHWSTSDARSVLGMTLASLGRPDEAEALLVRGHEELRTALGDDHPLTRTAAERLNAFRAGGGSPR